MAQKEILDLIRSKIEELDSTSKKSDEGLALANEIGELTKSAIFENGELNITKELLDEFAERDMNLVLFINENTNDKIKVSISYLDKFGIDVCDITQDQIILN